MSSVQPVMVSNSAGRKKKPSTRHTEQEKEDIQGTNDWSIVSKYSAEQAYGGHGYSPFEPFVPKQRVKRRAPIINRGYWLRMRSIEHVVQTFLSNTQSGGRKRVIVNLGCGYDPLPFKFLAQGIHKNVLFVDIDYPALISSKVKTTVLDASLCSLLTNLRTENHPGFGPQIILWSDQYLAVGCDLEELKWLSAFFKNEGLEAAKLLFFAEVSITYMRTEAADKVIEWAASFVDAKFSLLEQILPDGPEHPFASVMLRHFEKLGTPLRSVEKYPTLSSQINRFLSLGWKSADAGNLLAVWFDVFTPNERKEVWDAEPFDEWEEFFLLSQHYCLVSASTSLPLENSLDWFPLRLNRHPVDIIPPFEKHVGLDNWKKRSICHDIFRTRFSAGVKLSEHHMLYQGGMAATGRTPDYHILGDRPYISRQTLGGISQRMCHTATSVGVSKSCSAIVAGGRNSPTQPINECLLFCHGLWTHISPLPQARYRHCAAGNGLGSIIIFGGVSAKNHILSDWIIWDGNTWLRPNLAGSEFPPPRFAASMCWNLVQNYGLLTGGIGEHGDVLNDLWRIELEGRKITCKRVTVQCSRLLCRFGAQLVHISCRNSSEDEFYLVGGVGGREVLGQGEAIIRIEMLGYVESLLQPACKEMTGWQMLLVGHTVEVIGDGEVVLIAGGGSGCFSFGSQWNETLWILEEPQCMLRRNFFIDGRHFPTTTLGSFNGTHEAGTEQKQYKKSALSGRAPKIQDISRTKISSEEDFREIMSTGVPIIMEGLDIGPCVERWTWDYLKDNVGNGRKVVVHAADEHIQQMSFLAKNFTYERMDFGDFIDIVAGDEAVNSTNSIIQSLPFTNVISQSSPCKRRLYLRSLSSLSPNSKPANLEIDFPSLSADLSIPSPLSFATQNHHSSPLRISSSNIGMWLHFDVMSNILIHIRGEKRFRLYPPSDILHLSFPPGASSSSIGNSFTASIPDTHPMESVLKPGDVLFIPGLWPHAALPLTPCVAVNIFFRDLEGSFYAPGRDIYGNRDLGAYERGRQMITRVAKDFENVPRTARMFYLERLAMELLESARKH